MPDPLPSWNDGPAKVAILDFVACVTGDGPDHVPAPQRIATFDNDGTLWCEKPAYIQLDFLVRRLAEQAAADLLGLPAVVLDLRGQVLAGAGLALDPAGIEPLLASLAGRVEMGIVTSATQASFDAIHARHDLLRHFRFALTAETYERSKPAPDPYLLGVDRIGRPADECLVIEDSPRGLAAARAAGLRCIVLRSPLTHGHDFAGADRVVDSVAELGEAIEALL